jgi:Immunity protein Imm5
MVDIPNPPYPDLPDVVRQRREVAREALHSSDRHDLRPGYRELVVNAFEPWPVRVLTMISLALVVSHKVLPIWDEAFPTDHSLHEWLATLERALIGQITQAEAERSAGIAHSRVESLPPQKAAARAAAAAVSFALSGAILLTLDDLKLDANTIAARTAALSPPRPPEVPDLLRTDADYEFDEHGAEFWACVASSGGAPWESGSDAVKRGEYWEWWLDEALPAAYALVYPNIPDDLRH